MSKPHSCPEASWSAVQTAAVLILCRLAAFFCAEQPYSAAYAKGMFTAAVLTAGLLLPLLIAPQEPLPNALRPLYRGFALLWGSLTLVRLYALLTALHSPYPLLTLFLLIPVLLELQRLPQAAAARAASLLLFVTAAAFLLLPVSGIRTAKPVFLHEPDSAGAAFLREFQQCGELGLLPLLRSRENKPLAASRGAAAWLTVRSAVLPLTVIFGTMQNGRLLHLTGNPFFLLLARTPLSDALRTDGIWMLLAVGSTVLCLTAFLHFAADGTGTRLRYGIFLPFCSFALLFAAVPESASGLGAAAVLLGIGIPWMLRLRSLCAGLRGRPLFPHRRHEG
ncbi:MAG: hypothetical protein IK107_02620 [Oscillospiraceae bacterium]|nr:hypothetical protein [Oscillospiraceae bacterium]